MAESLQQWVGRQIREVDQDGSGTAVLVLTTVEGGRTWDTWESPFLENQGGPGEAELAREISAVAEAQGEELPTGRHQFILVAKDSKGAERGTRVIAVTGKQKKTTPGLMGGAEGSLTQMVADLAGTMKLTLEMVNIQLRSTGDAMRGMHSEIIEAYTLLREAEKVRLVETAEMQGDQSLEKLFEMASENLPAILELAKMANSGTKPSKGAIRAVVGGKTKESGT